MKISYLLILIFLFSCLIPVFSLELNTVSLDEMLVKTGIDMLDAMKILEYRKNNKIRSVQQLLDNNIISHQTASKIREALKPDKEENSESEDFRVKNDVDSFDRDSGTLESEGPDENKLFQKILDLMRQNRYQEASKNIRTFFNNFPESVYFDDVIYFTGAILEETENFERAVRYYNRIINNYYSSENSVIALYRIAVCYEKMDELDEARKYYRRIKNEFSNTLWAEKAGERLKEI
ncbi:MAG: tetratricopeptide repeat protein [Candidatus Muiribacteriota bacterium]